MSARFVYPGKVKVVFAPAVANLAAPSGAEITAGTVLARPGTQTVDGMRVMKNWVAEGSTVDSPDLDSDFIPEMPATRTAKSPTIEFWDPSDGVSTKRTALARGTAGFMIVMHYGQTTGRRCEVWPVTVVDVNNNDIESGNKEATFTVRFAVTSEPNQAAVVP